MYLSDRIPGVIAGGGGPGLQERLRTAYPNQFISADADYLEDDDADGPPPVS